MKKIDFIWISALFLIIYSVSVIAWTDCTPDACPYGYKQVGDIVCVGSTCTRACAIFNCTDSGTTVKDDYSNTDPAWNDDDNDEKDKGAIFTPSSDKCYKFEFTGSEDTSGDGSECYDLYTDDSYEAGNYEKDCNGRDIDAYAGIGFEGNDTSDTWLETISESGSNYGYVDNKNNDYWDYTYISLWDDDLVPEQSGGDAGNWDGFNNVICDEAGTHTIYCAPTSLQCDSWGKSRCGYGCAGESTGPYIVMGVYADYDNNINDAYNDKWDCGASVIYDNDYFADNNHYKVIEYSTTQSDNYSNKTCDRTNEAPNATNVEVILQNPTAGDDLICNFTYYDTEDFEEKDSTFDWRKEGISQSINSQILGKGNLTVNDKWSCEVAPSDGLANGTEVGSSNVTILSTIQNPKMYVEDSLAWSSDGYYSDAEIITSFADELSNALQSCTADVEGYCNISLKFSSDSNGKLNLSGLGIYYEAQTPDTTPPSLNILSPINNTSYNNTNVDLNWTSDENVSWCAHSLDGAENDTSICQSIYNMNEDCLINSDDADFTRNCFGEPVGECAKADVNDDEVVSLADLMLVISNYGSSAHNITLTGPWSSSHNITIYCNDTAGNMGQSDYVYFEVTSGINVYNFSMTSISTTHKIFEFMVKNSADNENLTNISWSLNTGLETINSTYTYNLTPNNFSFIFVEYNYTQTGDFTVTASATDGITQDSETVQIDIQDIESSNLTLIYSSSLHRIFFFTITNMLSTQLSNVNWTFDTDDNNIFNSEGAFTLNESKESFVFIEYNYSSTGTYNVNATAINGTLQDSTTYGFTIT